MSKTPRHGLPFLTPGQAQKEFFHNEALQALDALVAAAVEEGPRVAPPDPAIAGACYIVADGATGAWSGHDRSLASYTAGGWRFQVPSEGLSAYVRNQAVTATFRNGDWEVGQLRCSGLYVGGEKVVGARGAAIAGPTGGATVDSQARSAIGLILSALRQHGMIAT